MNFKNCKRCRRIFQTAGDEICPECNAREMRDVFALREFLAKNPDKSVTETSAATEVSVESILLALESGAIDMTEGLLGEKLLNCKQCKGSIVYGRLCDKCRLDFNSALRDLGSAGGL